MLVALCSAAALPSTGAAQIQLMERTPELDRLVVFLGDWKRTPDSAEAPSARLRATWSPGRTWMTWDVEARVGPDGTVIHGRRQIAWDAATGVYRWSWLDTQWAHINRGSARWIDESTLELLGDPFELGGRTYRFRTRLTGPFRPRRRRSRFPWRS